MGAGSSTKKRSWRKHRSSSIGNHRRSTSGRIGIRRSNSAPRLNQASGLAGQGAVAALAHAGGGGAGNGGAGGAAPVARQEGFLKRAGKRLYGDNGMNIADNVIGDVGAVKDAVSSGLGFKYDIDSKNKGRRDAANSINLVSGAFDMGSGVFSAVKGFKDKDYLAGSEGVFGALSGASGVAGGISGLAGSTGTAKAMSGVQGCFDMIGGGLGTAGAIRDLWRTKGKDGQAGNRVAGTVKGLTGLGKMATGLCSLLNACGVKSAGTVGNIIGSVTAGLGLIGRVTDRFKKENPAAPAPVVADAGNQPPSAGDQAGSAKDAGESAQSTGKQIDAAEEEGKKGKPDDGASSTADLSDKAKDTDDIAKKLSDDQQKKVMKAVVTKPDAVSKGELSKAMPKSDIENIAKNVAKQDSE